MKWNDRKIITTSTAAFLTGAAVSVIGAIMWGSTFAIVLPVLVGLWAAMIILTAINQEGWE